MDLKQLWETTTVSSEQAKVLQAEGIGGMLRLAPFEMQVRRLDGQEATIQLTSAGAWIIVTGCEEDYILLTEQADRTLPDGRHPFEIPSGGRNDPDTNIFETLKREVFEETSIDLQEIIPIGLVVKKPGVTQDRDNLASFLSQPFIGWRDIWLDETTIEWRKQQKGGMIFSGMVDIRNLPSGSLPPDFLSRRYPGEEIYFDPPEGVDRNEISRIVLVPIDKVIDGSSQVLKMSSHYWAHKPGLLAFLASIRVEVE